MTEMTPDGPVVCLITAPQPDAASIAAALVERRLAACVNIVPAVRSVYRWEGELQTDDEALLVVKTTRAAVGDLNETLADIHPYDTYELVSLDMVDGSDPYLDWIAKSVSRAG
jgi:periplasmic divalent cation tolerance protein